MMPLQSTSSSSESPLFSGCENGLVDLGEDGMECVLPEGVTLLAPGTTLDGPALLEADATTSQTCLDVLNGCQSMPCSRNDGLMTPGENGSVGIRLRLRCG
jgi:hypothetical protein